MYVGRWRCGWRWGHSGHVNPVTGVFVPSDDDKYSVRPGRARSVDGITVVPAGEILDSELTLTNCSSFGV